MLYLIAIILGIILGLVFKGSLSNMFDLKFNKGWLVLAALLIQIAGQIMAARGIYLTHVQVMFINGFAFCILLVGFWYNRQYAGMLGIGMGCMLNAAVMMANGGRMPVSYDILIKGNFEEAANLVINGADIKHTIIDEGTRLVFLADIIRPPHFLSYMMQVISIGDVVVVLGLFVLIFEIVSGRSLGIRHRN